MKTIYYVQIEDKNIDEGHSTSTLAGLKDNLNNPIRSLVFSNHGQQIKDKYANSGVETSIFNNAKYSLTNFTDLVSQVKETVAKDNDFLVVLDDNNLGNSLGSRIAAALDIPLVAHVEAISGDSALTASRHIADTKAIRRTPLRGSSAVITASFNGVLTENEQSKVTVKNWKQKSRDVNAYVANNNSGNDLAYAKVVVAGGKGLQDADGFKPLQELADKLGASVAATKAVTDQGWVDKSKMVGISNLTIAPDVYYAFGIAGAVQHTAGMDKSKHVIAVNTDRTAPIFKLAQYGIVGDANKVIDGLINLF